MTTANSICRALVLIALAAASSAEARSHCRAAASDAFDSFLLSLSIAPAFCALSPANQAKDECRMLTAAAFEQTPLTVHGPWPNRAGLSANLQPHDCSGPPFGPLPEPLEADLRRYMPGGSAWNGMSGASTAPARVCRRRPISARSSIWRGKPTKPLGR